MNENTAEASIGSEVQLFTRHIDSLANTLPMMMVMFQEAGKTLKKNLDEYEAAHCKVETEGEKKSVQVPFEHYKKWNKLNDRHERYSLARILIPRSILVSLVSQYDAFLGRLLRSIFILRPETLNASEKQLSFAQLTNFKSIEDARDFIIEKEVESVLRSSHADQFKWMEARFGIPLTGDKLIWPKFIELTERRNLFVHADGIVSNQYLNVCKQHKCDIEANIVEGTHLPVPQKYFEESYQCVYEIGVKLAHVLWRKLLPDDREAADTNLTTACYELIDNDRYKLACALLDFVFDVVKKFSNERHELTFVVNRAQAYKWAGNNNMTKQIMSAVDWSAKGDDFKLADAVLAERWERAYEIIVRIGKSGPIDKVYYRDWPLFKELRKQSEFLNVYERVFGEPFVVEISSPKTENGKQAE